MPQTQTNWIILIVVCGFILLFVMNAMSNRMPNLHGLSVEEAKAVLKQSGKNIILGEKIGFEEPSIGKSSLLGKISKQHHVPSTDPSQPDVMNYTMYQIDTNQIATYLEKAPELLKDSGDDEAIKQLNELSNLSNELDALYKLEDEKNLLQRQLNYEREQERKRQQEEIDLQQFQEQQEEQARLEEIERIDRERRRKRMMAQQMANERPKRRVVPVRGLVNEITMDGPKQNRNRLGMSIPDRSSSTGAYAAKESFFW